MLGIRTPSCSISCADQTTELEEAYLVESRVQLLCSVPGRRELLHQPLVGRHRVGQLTKPGLERVQLEILNVHMILHLPGPAEVGPGLVELLAQDLYGKTLHQVGVRILETCHQVMSMVRQVFEFFPESPVNGPVLRCNVPQRFGVVIEIFPVEHADKVCKLTRDPSRVEAEGLHEVLHQQPVLELHGGLASERERQVLGVDVV